MDKIIIEGGRALSGVLPISGSKNAVLPLMVASLLTDEKLELEGTPRLADTRTLADVLAVLGTDINLFGGGHGEGGHEGSQDTRKGEGLCLHTPDITSTTAPYELVSKMRASFWVLGPLLARCGTAKVSLPGGCAIGTRPVDLYLKGLAQMGAQIDVVDGYVCADTAGSGGGGGLQGAQIDLPFVSVGVTHVLMMAASLAQGETIITNAASEPEVVDVGRCLQAMGAQIDGLGTRIMTITGVDKLSGTRHKVSRDRIEAGAYACAVAATQGQVELEGADLDLLGALVPALEHAGAVLRASETGVHISMRPMRPMRPMATDIMTQAYPGFATDLQAPFMGLMCIADGVSHIRETIFENRFMHVQELARLGANITMQGDTATVTGVGALQGAQVMATDLRASVTLIIAGLVAQGQTVVNRVYHLDRGYERLEEKLVACGASIWREKA